MNFALLGDDGEVLPLIDAIASHGKRRLVEAALVGEATLSAVLQRVPSVTVVDRWEEWIAADKIDVVIVAGAAEPVLEAARKLASAGRSLLIVPAVGQGLEFVYELTLIRDDTHVSLCPAFLTRFDPAVLALKQLIDEGRLGRLMHLQLERRRETGEGEGPRLLAQAEVDAALLQDIDLLRSLQGRYSRVTAIYSGRESESMTMAQVTLAGDDVVEASWSMQAGQPGSAWKLVAVGEERTVVLSRGESTDEIAIETDGIELQESFSTLTDSPAERVVRNCEAMVAGEPADPDWADLTHAFELIDASRRSVKRRRTIDVYFETASERSVFKTQMTAVGCGLLTLTFFAVLVLLVVGTLFDPGRTVMLILRGLVFLPLVLFLLMQMLLVITRPSAEAAEDRRSAKPQA